MTTRLERIREEMNGKTVFMRNRTLFLLALIDEARLVITQMSCACDFDYIDTHLAHAPDCPRQAWLARLEEE